MNINEAVSKLVKKYETKNPFEIAKSRNILIFYRMLGNVLGFYTMHRRIQMIYINSDIEEQCLTRFVCAHELGHSVLHPKTNTPFMRKNTFFFIDKIEREANFFAAQLLLYDEHPEEHESIESFYRRNNMPTEMIGKI